MKRLLLQLTRGVLTALALLASLPAAASLSAYAVWWPVAGGPRQKTVLPNTSETPICAPFCVRIVVQAKHPVSYVESDWREDTSDHSSEVTHPPFSRVDRIPEWDPPDAEVWQGPYYDAPLHNSKYVLKATVYFGGTNPPPPAETCEVSIYLQNLQIDDLETPPYFIWKPSVGAYTE